MTIIDSHIGKIRGLLQRLRQTHTLSTEHPHEPEGVRLEALRGFGLEKGAANFDTIWARKKTTLVGTNL